MSDVSVAVALFAPVKTSAPGGMPASASTTTPGGSFAALVDAMTAGIGPTAGALDAGATPDVVPDLAGLDGDALAATDGINVALAELAATMATRKPVMVAVDDEQAEPAAIAQDAEPSDAAAALASAIPPPVPVPVPAPQPPLAPVATETPDDGAAAPVAAATTAPAPALPPLADAAEPLPASASAPLPPAPQQIAPAPTPVAGAVPPNATPGPVPAASVPPVSLASTEVGGQPEAEPLQSLPAADPVATSDSGAEQPPPAALPTTPSPVKVKAPVATVAPLQTPVIAAEKTLIEPVTLAFAEDALPAAPTDETEQLALMAAARPNPNTPTEKLASPPAATDEPAPEALEPQSAIPPVTPDNTDAQPTSSEPAAPAAGAAPKPPTTAVTPTVQPVLVNTGTDAGTAILTPADVAVITAALEAAVSAPSGTVQAPPQATAPVAQVAAAAAAASADLAAPDLVESVLPKASAEKATPDTEDGSDPDDLLADAANDKPARVAADKPDAPARPPLPVNASAVAFAARVRGEGEDHRAAVQDAVQSVTPQQGQPQSLAAPQVAAAQPSAQSVLTAVPLAMVGVEIARMARLGETSFQIRLDPPELGRVDVSLDLSDKGEARAHLTVERRDTLDLFARDQRALERALREAGFEAKDGSVSVSLRNNGSDQQQQRFAGGSGQDGREPRFIRYAGEEAVETTPAPLPVDIYRPRRDSLLDVRI